MIWNMICNSSLQKGWAERRQSLLPRKSCLMPEKEGQVAKSREIANGLGLLTVFLVLKIWVGHMGISL